MTNFTRIIKSSPELVPLGCLILGISVFTAYTGYRVIQRDIVRDRPRRDFHGFFGQSGYYYSPNIGADFEDIQSFELVSMAETKP